MKPGIEEVVAAIEEKFEGAIEHREQQYDFIVIHLKKDQLIPVFQFLYEHETFRFRYLTTACGIHYPNTEKPFAMMYQLHSLENNLRLRFKLFTTANDLQFDSLTSLFSGANWMERETYDFYGFKFKGHPNLTRILNVDDMDYFPMRKEYPVEDQTRYDKDDTMFGREPAGYKKLS
jgi:NADH-quinone oxidoreductase subunit C